MRQIALRPNFHGRPKTCSWDPEQPTGRVARMARRLVPRHRRIGSTRTDSQRIGAVDQNVFIKGLVITPEFCAGALKPKTSLPSSLPSSFISTASIDAIAAVLPPGWPEPDP